MMQLVYLSTGKNSGIPERKEKQKSRDVNREESL